MILLLTIASEGDPVVRPRGMSSLFDTPNMSHSQTAALPVVPALRIMKKVWKMHDRTSSVSSSSTVPPDPLPRARSNTVGITNSASSSRSSSRSDLADVDDQQSRAITHGLILSEEQDIVLEAPKPRAVVRGLQRPPPGAQLPPSRQTGPDRMRMVRGGVQPSISAQRASLAKSTSATSRPSISHRSSVTPSVAPPARAIRPAPSSTTLRSHVPTPSTSSLRAPRRTSISNGMSSGARSALPLPSSRLPAPSGGIPTRLGGSKLSGVPRRVS